ncbi:hypothetical protein DPM33_33015 [Mesorhizobium hawassense]|uniref:Uncharacterized protein n=1 Tax=Mesorhizobium hawassense TaxID=1209954 RepID=A0A330H3S7_9HYPH|nr:hypothetical protein [Mesorhizobium hawassense]RAZ83206.1 hypothetical protein DPM33_33015 [Mesorhizobium hawassense]
MTYETRGTAALGEEAFDAAHPIHGASCRVLAVNDDDPEHVKWLVAFTDRAGRKVVETVSAVMPGKDPFGKTKHWTW